MYGAWCSLSNWSVQGWKTIIVPPFFTSGCAPVEVEEVALRHHLHEQRVEERVDVVRADVRDARHEDVGLPLHRHDVLREAPLQRLARAPPRTRRRRRPSRRRARARAGRRPGARPAAASTSVKASALNDARSAPVQSSSFLWRNSSGRSNMRLLTVVSMWKTLSVFSMRRPMRSTLVGERARARVHVRLAVAHDVRVVVRAQALVPAEADGDRLVPAVHRDEVQVHVDERGRSRRPCD